MSASPQRIVSASNARYRELQALAGSARERRRRGLSVIEGTHLLERYLARFGPPLAVFERDAGTPAPAGCVSTTLSASLFARVSQVESGPGPIAIVPTPRPELPGRLVGDAVYLDRIQDPGNVGTILRTCAAVGIGCVLAGPGTAFCWSPKVLRAGMGAHFDLDIHEGVAFELAASLIDRQRVLATAGAGDSDLYRTDLRAPTLWAFGNEGEGLAAEILACPLALRLSIPMTAAVESLNVATAAAICLFEQYRQRLSREA